MREQLTWLVLGTAIALPAAALAQESITAEGSAAEAVDTIGVEESAAAEPAAAGAATPRGNRLIEEIVVTAQKREENLQDVPIAITAFSEEKLDAMGIVAAQDLERITPGLTITNSVGFTVAYLRGVGTDAFLPGADPSVPFYLDGVPLLGAQGSSDTLGRVQRVEVLKGPQGTLFGRNATGGAVSIVTPNPDNVFSGDASIEFAKYNEFNAKVYANIPVVDGLAFSVAAFSNQHDNYYTNDAGPLIDEYSRGARVKLYWQALDNLSLTLAASLNKGANNAGLTFENTRKAPILGVAFPEDPKADRHIEADSTPGAQNNSSLYSLTIGWELPWADLKLIGSDQELNAPYVLADFDKSALPVFNFHSIKQVATQQTAELQILSNADTPFSDRFEWVAGAFYLKSRGGFDPIALDLLPNSLTALGVPGAQALTNVLNGVLGLLGQQPLGDQVRLLNYGVLTSESMSAYFQGTLALTDDFDLTAGVRYQDEKRNLIHARTTLPTANGEINLIPLTGGTIPLDELHAKQVSPRVALQWRPFDDNTQIYSSWARGFKSPTYNTVNLLGNLIGPIEPVKEEKVDSFELGTKADLLGGLLRVDAAAFLTKQKDLLTGFVAVASGGIVSYDNAGDAEIRGAEADFLLTPMPDLNPGLVVTGAVSYLDTEYTDYKNGRGYDEATGLAFGDNGITPLPARDFTGNRIVRTPKWTYTLGVNQTLDFGEHSVEFGIDTYYNSGFYFLPQNSDLYARDAYRLWNARVSYFYNPWKLQVTLFGENITDEVYNEVVFVDDFGRNQVLNAPRVYGVRAKIEF